MQIAERKLGRRTGSEGPRHDPYAFEKRTMTVNGEDCTLHCGLDCYISVDGERVLGYGDVCGDHVEDLIVGTWCAMVGMDPDQFDRAYERVHPYFDDPMGSLRDYE